MPNELAKLTAMDLRKLLAELNTTPLTPSLASLRACVVRTLASQANS